MKQKISIIQVTLILEVPKNHPLMVNSQIDELILFNELFMKNEFELKQWAESQNKQYPDCSDIFVHDFNYSFFKNLSNIESSLKEFTLITLNQTYTLADILLRNNQIQQINGFNTKGNVFEEYTLPDGTNIPVITFENMETNKRKEVDLVFSFYGFMKGFNQNNDTFIFTEITSGENMELTIGKFQQIGLKDLEGVRPFEYF